MSERIKGVLQSFLAVIGVCLAYPFVALAGLDRYLDERDDFFILGGQTLAMVPGIFGNAARRAYYRRTLALFDEGASVHFGSYFSKRGARVGARAGIGAYCVIGLVDIGARVRIASRVSVTSGLHYHGSGATGVRAESEVRRVSIGPNTWVGEGAVIGADVGADCIIGMGSVVIQPIPDRATVLGNPARRIPPSAA